MALARGQSLGSTAGERNRPMNPRPKPTTPQLLCIAAGAIAGFLLGFRVLDGGALGGGVAGVCAFIGAIPYKRAVDAARRG